MRTLRFYGNWSRMNNLSEKPPLDIYIALLHHPVYDKNGNIVTTAVANLDIHDISRSARTYGVKRYYIITPINSQRELVQKIMTHWQTGYGASFNPSRREAFDIVRLKNNLQEAVEEVEAISMKKLYLVATGAGLNKRLTSFDEMKTKLKDSDKAWFFLFGTGSGLAEDVFKSADFLLEPIKGPTEYNHLSVRSAAAIALDRLVGRQ
jgi:hypothetical protein